MSVSRISESNAGSATSAVYWEANTDYLRSEGSRHQLVIMIRVTTPDICSLVVDDDVTNISVDFFRPPFPSKYEVDLGVCIVNLTVR